MSIAIAIEATGITAAMAIVVAIGVDAYWQTFNASAGTAL
jgi:hypothetical protein